MISNVFEAFTLKGLNCCNQRSPFNLFWIIALKALLEPAKLETGSISRLPLLAKLSTMLFNLLSSQRIVCRVKLLPSSNFEPVLSSLRNQGILQGKAPIDLQYSSTFKPSIWSFNLGKILVGLTILLNRIQAIFNNGRQFLSSRLIKSFVFVPYSRP